MKITNENSINLRVRCIGRGATGDGCGSTNGRSGDVCAACGGMILSEEAIDAAAELARYVMKREEETP